MANEKYVSRSEVVRRYGLPEGLVKKLVFDGRLEELEREGRPVYRMTEIARLAQIRDFAAIEKEGPLDTGVLAALESIHADTPPAERRRPLLAAGAAFKYWLSPFSRRLWTTTVLGLIVLALGLYGCGVGGALFARGTTPSQGGALFWLAAGVYVALKLLVAATGLFMLVRNRLAVPTAIAAALVAIPATALHSHFIRHRPTNGTVLVLVLLVPLYLALVFYLGHPRVLKEFSRRPPRALV